MRESRAAADQRPDDVLPEAGEAGGERVRRHPAEVRPDSAADHECGGLLLATCYRVSPVSCQLFKINEGRRK